MLVGTSVLPQSGTNNKLSFTIPIESGGIVDILLNKGGYCSMIIGILAK